eukprot:10464040-Alexandrium_andersonii.AAC.1
MFGPGCWLIIYIADVHMRRSSRMRRRSHAAYDPSQGDCAGIHGSLKRRWGVVSHRSASPSDTER